MIGRLLHFSKSNKIGTDMADFSSLFRLIVYLPDESAAKNQYSKMLILPAVFSTKSWFCGHF